MLNQRGERFGGVQHAAAADGHYAPHLSAPARHPGVDFLRRRLVADDLGADEQRRQRFAQAGVHRAVEKDRQLNSSVGCGSASSSGDSCWMLPWPNQVWRLAMMWLTDMRSP